mgnify:CR=1
MQRLSQLSAEVRQYLIVTGNYWAFTLTDGALRMLVVLHFHQLGYSPLQVAGLFLFYEIFGSSRFTGKCCFYLQKEVVVIPVAVGHPLDHLDLVVHSLQHTGVQPVDRAGDNAVDVALEAPGKLLHRGQPTTHS